MPEINQTSTAIASYSLSKSDGIITTINAKIEAYIRENKLVSRNDIQRGLNLTARQAGCAVWRLIEKGIVRDTGLVHHDNETKRDVSLVQINPTPEIVFKKKSDKEKLKEIKALCEKFSLGEKDRLTVDILQIINQ